MTTKQRINLTLPISTLRLLDQVAPKGERSQMVNQAVQSYLTRQSRAKLRQQLKAGALARSGRDRELAAEWSLIDVD